MANRKASLLFICGFIAGLTLGCAHALTGLPVWNGEFFAGDASTAEIRRTQGVGPSPTPSPSGQVISAFDPAFNNYVCLSYQDLSCLYFSFVDNCKDWFTLTPSCPVTSVKTVMKAIKQLEQVQQKHHKKS